jgi:Zn-finger nucleic acid-binding protein
MILVRDRDYYFCEYCGVYHFPNPSADGIRNLGEAPERITCPLCNIPLDLAVFDDHYRGHQCSNCKGILFNRGTFRKTLEARRAKAASPAEPVTRASETELGRQVFCTKCKQRMSTHHTCDLIWLDYGELNKAVSAPGNDRGSAHREQTVFLLDEMKKREKKDWNQQEIDLLDFIKKILW